MLFLSAQPDTLYFVWQVELQLFNLQQNGWANKDIHVLFAYDTHIGINPDALTLKRRFPKHSIYFYEDTRENKKYASTIRPHVIEKHLTIFPELREEAIFYIDSDVVFRKIPDFSCLLNDENWYASNTQSYMSCDILINLLGYEVFEKMCRIVGVSSKIVQENISNTGGAQYIIKNVPHGFWAKVEDDSNKLYDFLYQTLFTDTNHSFFKKYPINIWLTEMWVVYWNTMLLDKTFIVHPLLDFCWANQTKKQWDNVFMLHYTGGLDGAYFKKINYTYSTPYYSDLSYIDSNSSSYYIKSLINEYRICLNKERIILNKTSLIVYFKDNDSTCCVDYLLKYLDVNIMAIGSKAVVNSLLEKYPCNVRTFDDEKHNESYLFYRSYENILDSDILGLIPACYILPISQILEAISIFDNTSIGVVYPYTKCHRLDILTSFIFKRVLDDAFILSNIGKLFSANCSVENCLFFRNKKTNIQSITQVVDGYLFIK